MANPKLSARSLACAEALGRLERACMIAGEIAATGPTSKRQVADELFDLCLAYGRALNMEPM